jgi:sulfur carrier protein ThiS
MRIYLGGHLNFYHPKKENWLEVALENPTPLKDVVERAGIPLGEISLVSVNGEIADLQEAIISETDEVKLFSPVGGG